MPPNGPNYENPWTDERVERLKALWADGLTCSQVGDAMGMSRSAVIGKVHRLGLSGRAKERHVRPPPRPRSADGRDGAIVQSIGRKLAVRKAPPLQADDEPFGEIEALPPPAPADLDIPMEQRCTLFELGNSTCRWPVGTPGESSFFFCGSPEADLAKEQPYCRHHMRAAGRRTSALTVAELERRRAATARMRRIAAINNRPAY